MVLGSRIYEWIEAKINRPADQGVLDADRNPGSKSMREGDSRIDAEGAARRARRSRDRRRWRWMDH